MKYQRRRENELDSSINGKALVNRVPIPDDQTESEFVETVFGCYPERGVCPRGLHVKQDELKTVCHCAYGLEGKMHHSSRRAFNRFVVELNGLLDRPLPLLWV